MPETDVEFSRQADARKRERKLARLDDLTVSLHAKCQFETGEPSCTSWRLDISVPRGDKPKRVFSMDGWTFDLHKGRRLADWLDEIHADTSVFCTIADGDALVDEIDGIGSRLLLVDKVWLKPTWRGMGGVGLFLTGIGIQYLCADTACVAMHASPFELRAQFPEGEVPIERWQRGVEKLTTLWQRLGFRPLNGNLVLNPSMIDLDLALARLARSLGLQFRPDSDFIDEELELDG